MAYGVVLGEAHHGMRERTRALLEQNGWPVVGEGADVQSVLEQAKRLAPALIILDISLPGAGGFAAAAAEILRTSPDTKIVVFSVHDDEDIRNEAFRAGAHGYVSKCSSDADLLCEIRRVHGPMIREGT